MDPDRRPTFARDFPRHPALDALVAAFSRGDYALVRFEGGKLAESVEDERVRASTRTLIARTHADPLAVWLLLLAGALLVVLSGYWIVHERMSAPHDAQPRTLRSLARSIPAAT